MKIDKQNKLEIMKLIEVSKLQLGSYNRVSKMAGVNTATITNNILKEENWNSVSDDMWVKVGNALGYKFASRWVTVETTNLKMVKVVLEMAQQYGEMKCIAHKAGGGKTSACDYYKDLDKNGSVFLFKCEKWSHREFLNRLAQSLGIDVENEKNLYRLSDKIIAFFKVKMASCEPLLIIDQADKLANRSLSFLIQFYNELKYETGCVIVGTEHLAKKIKAGVRRSLESFDELDDRLGMNYVDLLGYTKQDVSNICTANGVEDQTEIARIWDSLNPEQVPYGDRYIRIVKSGRRLETEIQNYRKRAFKSQLNSN